MKQAADWLLEHDVPDVYVGNLKDVLSPHWSAEVTEKIHAFWSHGQLTTQPDDTSDLAGISVEYIDEYDTSSECPYCSSDNVSRDGDYLLCGDCNSLVHADIAGAGNILPTKQV